MASRTDTLMYLDLEFFDENYFGFVNFYNSLGVAGGTIGFGNVEEKRLGVYGTDDTNIFEIKNFNDVEIHNYKDDIYFDSKIKVFANNLTFSIENSDFIKEIYFNKNISSYVKVEEDGEVEEQPWGVDKSGLVFSEINLIGFVSSNKMSGYIDINDSKIDWHGEIRANSFLRSDDVSVSFSDHTHDEFYTKEEIDVISTPSYKERGLYIYSEGVWSKIEINSVDEYYDIDSGNIDSYWWTELEKSYYKVTDSDIVAVEPETVEIVEELPNPLNGDIAFVLENQTSYVYEEEWVESDDIVIVVDHKSDIIEPSEDDVFYITNTKKFYKYNSEKLDPINRPNFVYEVLGSLPQPPSEGDIFEVSGGTFYMYNNDGWVEISRPMIKEIHYSNIDDYSQTNSIVFVTRRK